MNENKDSFSESSNDNTDEIRMENDIVIEQSSDNEEAGMEVVAHASAIQEVLEDETANSFNIKKEIKEWAYAIVFALIVTFLIKGFIFDVVMVDGRSMETTLLNGDRLILTKLGYKPKAGDIIVLDSNYKPREEYIQKQKELRGSDFGWLDEMRIRYFPPRNLNISPKYYVKRVIAMPGQVIDINPSNGDVTVNGVVLNEPYIKGAITRPGNETKFPYTVEQDRVFVMGDNRNNSSDSRVARLGTVPYVSVLGRAAFRIWPLNAFGSIYK